MTIALKLRRGTTAENDAFTGQEGELTYDTKAKQLRVHDGSTPGGAKVAKEETVTGATASAAGKAGLVPAPAAGAQNKYLRGDGTWQAVDATPPAITVAATTLAAGSKATVTKSGTDKAPEFTFGIPKGEKGDKGEQGDTGARGPQGPQGPQGPAGAGLSQIGAATLYGTDTLVTTGSGNKAVYSTAIQRDAYGRVTKVGRWLQSYNCDCNCNCSTD